MAGSENTDKHVAVDEAMLKRIVQGLLSSHSGVQEQTVLEHIHPEVIFYHWAVRTRNREDYLKCFRLYTLLNASKPVFREIIIEGDKAMVWVDQHVRCNLVPCTWWKRAVVPTLVILKFVELPGGRLVVKEHTDHISLYSFIWSLGGPGVWTFEKILQPFGNWTCCKLIGAYDSWTRPARQHLSWFWGVPAGSAPPVEHDG
eukprot:TRINITY_DN10988_c0_g1_i1.p1 TRINITY_DN10988_c0_g1~~TRINITY_DN10988_c0_g1_i1.p1  ORF type:complete len:215 (-),score=69.91 TRINITY_DN10988_c0_g1_i1:130-732(-)